MRNDGLIADLKQKIHCTERKIARIIQRGGLYTIEKQKQQELLDDLRLRLEEAENQT